MMLKRQKNESPVKAFSVRLPEEIYDNLVDFALAKRLTLTAAVTYFVIKALNSENGKPYEPYTSEKETNTSNDNAGKEAIS